MGFQTHDAVSGDRGRILIVDDETEVRKPLSMILKKAGYEVVEAENGEEAIEVLKTGDNSLMVDTIVCDIRMPKASGAETIAYFRAQYPSVPVVVLTGYPEIESAVSFLKRGISDYLVKPVSGEELLGVIRKSVDQHVILKDQFVT